LRKVRSITASAEACKHPVHEPAAQCVSAWLFTPDQWRARDPNGDYVDHERRTISRPSRRSCLVSILICRARRRSSASARIFLDVTPPGVNKGTFAASNTENGFAQAIEHYILGG
jgi:hypothetical protein